MAAHDLKGTSAGVSAASGNLINSVALAGASAGASTTTARITGTWLFVGAASGVAVTSSNMIATRELVGAAAGVATITSNLTRLYFPTASTTYVYKMPGLWEENVTAGSLPLDETLHPMLYVDEALFDCVGENIYTDQFPSAADSWS